MNEIFNFLEFYVFINENELGKINFPLEKMEFGTNWEFCAYHIIFGVRKGPADYTISKTKSVYYN